MAQKSILKDEPEILIKKYYQLLVQKGIKVEKIVLFGSYAKGSAKAWSDLDLCVVSKNFGKDPHDELVMLMKLTSDIDDMIEPHPYHPNDLKDKWDPLAAEIRKHGKTYKFS
jgi:predicted nucleotidyltransferase